MPSWRRPRRRLLDWLSNSRKNSGSGVAVVKRISETAVGGRVPYFAAGCWLHGLCRERRLNASFSLVGGVFWENRICWVVFNDVGGFD